MGHTVGQFLRQDWLILGMLLLILLAGAVILWPTGAWPLATMIVRQQTLLVIGIFILVGGYLVLWKLPQWQAARPDLEPMERFTAENEARKTLAQILGGAAVLLSLCVAWGTLEVSGEGQITDRFTKAIVQLGEGGENNLTVRLGGTYTLERIARDSERDHWPVMEALTTYVRTHAPWPSQDPRPLKGGPPYMEELLTPSEFRLATDIQAVLAVLKRRTRTYEHGEEQRLHLTNTGLRTADLRDTRLQGAILYQADLEGAYLQKAKLNGTYLRGGKLERACLREACLQGAHLRDAQLQRSDLQDAQLQGADLQDAQLQGADLRGAQLEGACLAKAKLKGVRHLTVEQLLTVKTLYGAELDSPQREQIEQRRPSLLDKPRHNRDDLCAE